MQHNMFKTAATKIAHNSTIPSLGGNKDLRPLQGLITAEKSVLISLQRLSVDFGKAAEALRVWGSGEGEDLLDTLSASTNILTQFAAALSNYASHEHAIRDHMKGIRSREEALDELKRRRKALISKADTAEKKLSKMSPEHKNLGVQTDTLNRLRDEIRSMDSEIMSDEASLGDYKRSRTKAWMGLKFGGLLECCEKGTIIGEFGRLVINEIPEDTTQPGMARPMYMNHQKVNSLISDATRCVDEVAFSTAPAPGTAPPAHQGMADYLAPPHGLGTGQFLDTSDMTGNMGSSIPPSPISLNAYPEASRSADDFGVASRNSPIASRFSTFPATTGNGGARFSLHDGSSYHVEDDSFSSSIAAALDARKSTEEPAPSYETHQVHLSGPPAGAAPPLMMPSPWELQESASHNTTERAVSAYGDDVGLAYMTNPEEEPHSDHGLDHQRSSSKEVHFGQVQDIATELDNRHEQGNEDYQAHGIVPPGEARSSPKRVPPPSMSPEEEERALNADAARKLSREMDSFSFDPSSSALSATVTPPPIVQPLQERGVEQPSSLTPEFEINNRSPSPLIPPVAPFAQQRGVSPGPIDINSHHDDIEKTTSSPIHNSPPRLTISDRTASSISNGSSYRTPPEYPRSIGTSSFGQRSNSSFSGSMPSSPAIGAPRTISAAAFRRPAGAPGRSTSADLGPGSGLTGSHLADVSPLQPKKRGLPNAPSSSLSHSNPSLRPYEAHNFNPGNRVSQAGSDDHYDYISAYTDASQDTGSPQRNDYGSLGQVRVTNDLNPSSPGTPVEGQHPYRPGYGEGRFATNLEGELR
ncbi:MAG: hypothetical protein NXY57DRAFT_1019727 [Lentinula lateritia]|uniref:Eisosome component PIL1-domain-containing protein n=1 Tax=Lentinula lateritia TaxID=40482 RepID=A0ABQ8VEM0_9AGAR|nr:MAG: hypothetical protein NXY57DRAFT_1019727 [Lentinula lateritia]KAJ4491733.1 hypothetical protein C8R41DRAFT_883266 [Lentinula lateritia]